MKPKMKKVLTLSFCLTFQHRDISMLDFPYRFLYIFSCIDKENLFNNQELLYLLSLLGVKIKTSICQHLSLLLQIIVAVEKKELPQLEKLYQRGLENGVKDLKILDSKQIKEVEPYCEVSIPSTEFLKLKFRSTRAYFFFILITSEHFLVQKCYLSDHEFFQIFSPYSLVCFCNRISDGKRENYVLYFGEFFLRVYLLSYHQILGQLTGQRWREVMEKTSRRRVVKYILVMRSEDILVCICYLLHHAFDPYE